MPDNFVGHEIYLIKDLGELDSARLDLPGDFGDVAAEINNDLHEIKSRTENACDMIIPTLATMSMEQQKAAIIGYDSVRTGRLLGSVAVLSESRQNAMIGTHLFYAKYVDEGRGSVVARDGGYLHFFTKDGAEVFTKRVGPAAPRPYAKTSSDILSSHIDSLVGGLLDKV